MKDFRWVTWRLVIRASAGVIAIAAIFTVITLATAGPGRFNAPRPGDPVPPEVKEREPTSTDLKRFVEEAAKTVLFHVRMAGGDKSQCFDCEIVNVSSVLEQTIAYCEKVSPEEVLESPAYQKDVHEPAATALASACSRLRSAQDSLGSPRDTAAWRTAAKEAADFLKTALTPATPTPTATQAPASTPPAAAPTATSTTATTP